MGKTRWNLAGEREIPRLGFLAEEENLRSKTRKGTMVNLPENVNWKEAERILRENGGPADLSNGMRRAIGRLEGLKAFRAGLKFGFLGTLIADAQYEMKGNISREYLSEYKRIEQMKG